MTLVKEDLARDTSRPELHKKRFYVNNLKVKS